MNEGKLYITLKNSVYPLAPLSELECIVQNIPQKLYLRFEREKSKETMLLNVYEMGKEPRIYTSSKVKVPDDQQLSEYQGQFFSEELQVTFEIRLEEGKLHFVHKMASQIPLKPLYMDLFQFERMRIHFVRNEEKKITGFLIDADRVKNLRFIKLL